VARFRLSAPARADLATILESSARRRGEKGRRRYARLLSTAMRTVARDPESPLSQERDDLQSGIRGFHVRHARSASKSGVRLTVHVIFYRIAEPGVVEILRVLHEHMDPGLRLAR